MEFEPDLVHKTLKRERRLKTRPKPSQELEKACNTDEFEGLKADEFSNIDLRDNEIIAKSLQYLRISQIIDSHQERICRNRGEKNTAEFMFMTDLKTLNQRI